MKHRHCIFTSLCLDLLWPSKDTVVVEIPIAVPEYSLPDGSGTSHIPLELLIIRKRDMKTIMNNIAYLKNFVAPIQAKNFPVSDKSNDNNQLVVLGESDEAVNHIIDT